MALLTGGFGYNKLTGTSLIDTLSGLAGNDMLYGFGGDPLSGRNAISLAKMIAEQFDQSQQLIVMRRDDPMRHAIHNTNEKRRYMRTR